MFLFFVVVILLALFLVFGKKIKKPYYFTCD
ncbi:hypothetical protein VCHENC02_0713A, partial [Vibrio harveyi]